MELFKPGSFFIDFMGKRRFFLILSVCVLALSVAVFVWKYFAGTINWGIDFAGGTVIDLEFSKKVDISQVRQIVNELGYKKAVIQDSAFSGREGKVEFIIRVERIAILSPADAKVVEKGLKDIFGEKLQGFEYDKDSGDQFGIEFKSAVSEPEIKKAVAEIAQQMNKPDLAQVSVRMPSREGEYHYSVLMTGVAASIERKMGELLAESSPHVQKVEFVGPEVGKKLRTDALLAMLYAFAGILVYIGFRFNMTFSPGAVIADIHDAGITIGIFTLLGLEMNLTFMAAVLTIIGYSTNDTIVIYDRIRENMAKLRSQPLEHVMNTALNETLSRTLLTSLVTELSLVGLLIMGFGEIRDFAIAMTVGIVVGTYSSIYIASAFTLWVDGFMKKARAAS